MKFLKVVLALCVLGASGAGRSGGRAGGRSSGGFSRRPSKSRTSTTRRDATATKEPETKTKTEYVPVPVHTAGGMGGMNMFMGLSLIDSIMHEQRRAEMMRRQLENERQMGKNEAEIENLKAQLAAQENKVSGLQQQAEKEKTESK